MDLDVAIERTATELLIEAREFISDPARWCQGEAGITSHGVVLSSDELVKATQCCALGAVERAWWIRDKYGWLGKPLAHACDRLDLVALTLYPESNQLEADDDEAVISPAAWVNDHLGHAAILRVYDAAIAASQEVAPR